MENDSPVPPSGEVWQNLPDDPQLNPCFNCGACCRHFRISFYQGETDAFPGGYVPAQLTEQLTPFMVCMKGTAAGNAPCCALQPDNRCAVYQARPSVCRQYRLWDDSGAPNPDCQRLRKAIGLPPLEPLLSDPKHDKY